jgi:hypothetical protein
MYFACFHARLKYGLTLCGGDPESIRIFLLQKRVIRIIGNAGQHASCRNLLKDLNILPLLCLYISEIVCCVKSNVEKMKYHEVQTIVHTKNQIFILNFAELLFLKTVVHMWV